MALSVEKTSSGREFKVKDLSQADFGRLEIELAEVEMPGLMAWRAEFGPSKPFAGVKISGSLHMTTQTAVLMETLTALGAQGRWCACNIICTQDHAAAAIARDSAAVFAWKGETFEEYWWCIERCLDWGEAGGPDLIVDDGGDATLLIHEGIKTEEEYEKTGKIPDPESTDNAEFKIVLTIIRDGLNADPKKYRKMKERLVVLDGSANFAQQTLLAAWRVVGIAGALREPNLDTGYDGSVALADDLGTVYDNRGMVAEHLRRLLPFAGIGACSVAINGLAAGPGSPADAFLLFALLLGGLFMVILHVLRA